MSYKLLIISTLYPNSAQPRNGIFTEHRMRNMLKSNRVEIKVVAPVPWFPIKNPRIQKYSAYARVPHADERYGISVIYPRFLIIPKFGMNLAPLLLAMSLIRPLKKLQRDGYDFDLIDAYYFYPDGVAAALLARYFKKPVVITAYGTDINLIPQYRLPRHMIQWAARNAAGITTVCQALKDGIVELGVSEEAIQVILHGVDLDLFKPPSNRTSLRTQLGLTRTTLLSVGHLIERKGHHIVIQALAKLPEIDLLVAGDGEEELSLKELAVSLGVSERVRFLGHVNQDELCTYYGAADALVLASSREGIANVLLESMACGTPVIVTNVWGAPEVITAPQAGVLMPERTPEALVEAVQSLFNSYPDRAETRRFVEQFSWDHTTELHLAVLDKILAPQE